MFEGSAISVKMLDAGIAELKFDLAGESVNKFNAQTVKELDQALTALENADDLKGVIVSSGKPVFIVGADITEFETTFSTEGFSKAEDPNNVNFNRLEDLPVPVVAAINGYAMGGGLELALACDFRIMSTMAKIGLPETKLGLIPGWGGTVRLPRIAGADTAIDWIASGKEQRPDAALKAGIVDGVVETDQLGDAALKVLHSAIAGKMDYQARREQKTGPLKLNQTEAMMAFETSKAFVAGVAGPNYPAPIVAIECMQQAAGMSRDEALAVEAAGFEKVATTDVTKALVGIFMSDQL
ncbi:MAG: enoyl-CoA hydratase/isomerase family protein, partial [Arenicella sp.]|nr:enoyl-CoA hydratase/isomerase family protein [Arenicella sp.]